MRARFIVLALISLAGCSDLMKDPLSLGGNVPGMGGSGRPGTINPGQVLSMGQDLYKAATLSDEEVKKIADESIAEMDAKNPVAPSSNPYAKRLARLTGDLKNVEGLNLDFKVYLVKDVNAVSLPNGSVRVFSALMDRMNDDELKFVLGHEIAHIKNGHRKARLQRAYATSAATKAANTAIKASTSSSVGGYAAVLGGDLAAKLAGEVINAQFSQGDETECDEFGVHLLASRNLPKEAAVKALLKLGEESGAEKSSNDFFASLTSSHPDPVARAKHIQEMIPELSGKVITVEPVRMAKSDASPERAAHSAHPALPTDETMVESGVEGDTAEPARVISRGATNHRRAVASRKVRHGSWYIQVGAFSNKDYAQSLQHSIKQGSKTAAVREGMHSGQPIYRVIVGPFDSRETAQAEMNEVVVRVPSIAEAFVRNL